MTDLFGKCRSNGGYFGELRVRNDRYFSRPMLDGLPGPRMIFEGKEVVMWAVNNYLDLAGNLEILKIAAKSLETHATSTPMGSRLLTGNTKRHRELEQKLAKFIGKQSAVVFNYGYMGVLGTISALIGADDEVIIDKLSHASMVDAAILASAGRRFRVFRHNDMGSLEQQLKSSSKHRKGGILIVTEGVYGMRGDLAKVDAICELKEKYGARLFIDDAHGFGVIGPGGKGIGEHFGVQDKVDLYFGTFAKAFAAIGGVTAGDEDVVEYVRYNARTNVFAKSLPMVYVDVIEATLGMVEDGEARRERMWEVARRLQKGFVDLGFDIGDTQSPITPVYVPAGDMPTGMAMIKMLREDYGVFVSGVMHPVVPQGVVLFRMIPTAAHTEQDVDQTLAAFKEMRDRLKLDPSNSNISQSAKSATGQAMKRGMLSLDFGNCLVIPSSSRTVKRSGVSSCISSLNAGSMYSSTGTFRLGLSSPAASAMSGQILSSAPIGVAGPLTVSPKAGLPRTPWLLGIPSAYQRLTAPPQNPCSQ